MVRQVQKTLKYLSRGDILLLLLPACHPAWVSTPSQPTFLTQESVTICIDLPKKHRQPVISAIHTWNKAIHKWKFLKPKLGISDSCNYTISESPPPPHKNPSALASTTSLFGRDITLYTGRYELDPYGVTLHELGHSFGARHMEGTMMSHDLRGHTCPDAATIAQIATANGIDPAHFSYCTVY